MSVILFEDRRVSQLHPITTGRPAFEISCGSYRLVDLVRRLGLPVEAIVRPYLRAVLAQNCPDLVPSARPPEKPLLLVNARMVPAVSTLGRLRHLLELEPPVVVRTGKCVAAAVLAAGAARPDPAAEGGDLAVYLDGLAPESTHLELPLFDYPHDVVRYHPAALAENLEDRLATGAYKEIADGLFAAEGASLGEHAVIDSHDGPILLDAGARIGPYCYLSGPAYVGRGSRVIEHAAIKDGVALGHTTKVGGEVEASTVEPFTNKQHHGFLGHSYLGSWVNLGAGTSNSDLKNTYGPVSMEYDGRKVATGMQFLGCILGDYSKTAVNTSIFTGKTIGVCSMVYGFVTTNVASFVNYARFFGQVTEATVEVMAATQARMFERRGVKQRPCDVELLEAMYELTRHERQLASEPLAL